MCIWVAGWLQIMALLAPMRKVCSGGTLKPKVWRGAGPGGGSGRRAGSAPVLPAPLPAACTSLSLPAARSFLSLTSCALVGKRRQLGALSATSQGLSLPGTY